MFGDAPELKGFLPGPCYTLPPSFIEIRHVAFPKSCLKSNKHTIYTKNPKDVNSGNIMRGTTSVFRSKARRLRRVLLILPTITEQIRDISCSKMSPQRSHTESTNPSCFHLSFSSQQQKPLTLSAISENFPQRCYSQQIIQWSCQWPNHETQTIFNSVPRKSRIK